VQQPARQLQLHLLPGLPGRWIHELQQGRSRLKNSSYKDLEKKRKRLACKGTENHGKRLTKGLPIKTFKSIKKDFKPYKKLKRIEKG
jgi:hypothetical protein